VNEEIDALKASGVDVYAAAIACYNNNTYSDADLKDAIRADVPDTVKNALLNIAKDIIEGVKAEEEKNLTKAQSCLGDALSTLDAIELETTELAKRLMTVYLKNGDTQNANTVMEEHITDEVLADSDEEFKAFAQELSKLYDAQYTVNEVFYPYYYNAYAYGGDLDKAEINAALDELITDDADEYLVAFVSYYKYLAEGFTDEDTDTMLGYLTEFAEKMQNYPVLYGTSLAEVYRMKGEYEKAEEVAKEVLDVNIADDYSNSILALMSRINGNVNEALKTAENGIKLSGATYYCASEALIDNLINGDIEKAFEYAKDLYEENLTVDNCEYILIISALYDGSNEEIKSDIDSYVTDINEIFESYGITVSENAQGIIDGDLTPEDVFLKTPYSLS